MKCKELIETLKKLDNNQDLPVMFCNGSIFIDGLTTIGEVVADEGHFIVIKRVGKYGCN